MRIHREVHGIVRQIEKEGLLRVLADVFDGALRVAACEGVLLGGFDALHDVSAIDERQRRLRVAFEAGFIVHSGLFVVRGLRIAFRQRFASAALRAFCGGAHVIRVRDAEVAFETLRGGQEFRLITEMPFADAGGGVAVLLQHLRDGDLLRIQTDRSSREEHARNGQHAFRVATGHHRRA